MRINVETITNCSFFKDLKTGDVFKYDGKIYLKTDFLNDINAVALQKGFLDYFEGEEIVTPTVTEPMLKVKFISK